MRHYMPRVCSFLHNPPADYMRAMGYDADPMLFSKDCHAWRVATSRHNDPPNHVAHRVHHNHAR